MLLLFVRWKTTTAAPRFLLCVVFVRQNKGFPRMLGLETNMSGLFVFSF
jgi:hypothetical protein